MTQGTPAASQGNGSRNPPIVVEELAREMEVVRRTPESDEAWDHLEKTASELDQAHAVAALYDEVLRGQLALGAAQRIGERAVRFHEEWSPDDPAGLMRILDRLLAIESTSAWAFERVMVTLTVAGRWDDLFEHYDRAIAEASTAQKTKLLEEAAQVARDVAGKPERAIQYLLELQRLSPSDAALAESTERMLERNQRWSDLVRFWQERIEQLPPAEGHRLRENIAGLWVERLNQPADALTQLRRLVSESEEDREACRLLEVILATESWPAAVRRGALDLLRARYERAEPSEIVRILRSALAFADTAEAMTLHREIAQRLAAAGDSGQAMNHYATLLVLDPHAGDARQELRRLADEVKAHGRLADALVAAAGACRDALRVALLVEAARTRAEILGDGTAAIELYRRILDDPETDTATLLQAARRLNELFEAAGRGPERLAILEHLATLEPIASDRRGALGQAAALAAALGDGAKAIALWERRLDADAKDHEALDGLLGVLEAEGRSAELVAGLRRRVALDVTPHQKRADLIRIAVLQARELERRDDAIATWKELRDRHGEDAEITDAMAALLEAEGRWAELAELLEGAAARDGSRWIDAGVRLGDLYRRQLGDAERAAVSYQRTLRVSPGHEAARAGLIGLVESRLERAPDAPARATILEDQARMEEETGALAAARRSLGRALLLAPDRRRIDPELVRLAGATDAWAEVAGALDQAAAAARDPSRVAELRMEVGSIHETRLGDPLRALDAYRAAVVGAGKLDAAEALARTAKLVSSAPVAVEALEAAAGAIEQRGGGDALERLLDVLADLRRPAGGRPLADTLRRLMAHRPGNLDLLREIAQLAVALEEGGRAVGPVEHLLDEASRQLSRTTRPEGAETHALWALETLVQLHSAAGRRARALDLLLEGARLPFDAATVQDLRRRAAAAALETGDERRAAELYRNALERDPSDIATIQALIPLTQRDDQLAELLVLRRQELDLTHEPTHRLALRLEISRIAGVMEARSDRVEMLVANLDERPGHEASIDALCELLGARAGHARLADVLAAQAAKLEKASEGIRAARLWERVARIAEEHLENTGRALESYRKAAAHDPTPASLDALARLHTRRGDHAAAAIWLERRLAHADEEPSRSDLVLRLAHAYVDAKQPQRAMAALESGLAAAPGARPVLELLLQVYRAEGALEPLGRRLVAVCQTVDDAESLLKYASEVADIFGARLGTPELAIPVLERAVKLVPADRALRTILAQGLGAAGRYDEARALFHELIAGYGRRRSPERADLHRKFAAVARANGDVALAVEQLELATKLDVGRPSILATLATVARDAGLLEQAEHAYRALLLVVRRRGADEPETPLAAEALYELSRIAVARGDQVQARELIESAVESAVHHAAEARRLERHLLARGEADLLLRITDARLHVAEQPAEKAEILATRARGLAALGKSDEALATWLAAIAEVPSSLEHQRDARAFAATQGRIPAYVEGVSVLLQRRRRREDWAAQADLVSQLATIVEEQGDLRRAAGLYGQLAEHGERVVEAWAAVVRLAGQLADTELQAEALEKLARLSGAAAADLDADALYRVAELQLGRADTGVAGRATLARALQLDPRHDIAADLLWLADVTQPLDEAGFASYEELARQSGNARTLLTFFERRARRPEATLMQDREAVSLAIRLEEGERAEALLVGAVERARGEVGGLAGASWALFSLMERRLAAGDWRSAIAWLREAAKVGEPARVRALGLQLAGTIAHDDPAAAAETYRLLLEQDPADRDVWEPLLTLHQRLGDTVAAKELAERLIAFLVQPADRNRVRMLFVAHLVERVQVDEAIGVLNEVIFDDPDHVDATRQLADLLERAGRCDQLAELLTRQFDYAYERGARDLIVALSLRIGQRVGPEDAAAIYRRALEIAPDDRTVLRALAACIDPARDARARAEVLERLLAAAEPAEAPAIALELADLRTSLGEPAETERALVAGRRAAPEHVGLRDRMEKHYREEEEHAKLAELLVTTAAEIQDAGRAVGMLREAAEIQRDFLLEFGRAAACLAGACRLAPTDAGLIQEYIATLVLAGNRDAAIAEVSRALEVSSWPLDVKVALLRQRAELNRGAGALEATIVDLEAVFALVGAEVAPELVAVLEQRLQALEDAWEHDVERETFARLVAVLEKVGDLERLRTMLEHWTAGRPDDVAALRKLLALETKAERWSGVIQVATQLFRRESGEARVELAIAIADAADRAGQPSAGLTALAELRRTATGDRRVLERLERLYLATESYGRLAELLRDEATRTADAVARAALLVRVGQLHLDAIGDPAAAIEPLEQAAALLPEDLDVTLLLADAFTRAGHHAAARKILEPHVAEQKKRRSPKVPMLLRQMAHLAGATGDSQSQLGWLQEAFDADRKSGLVAAELANLASALQKYDVALKVLRCISLMDDPSPFTRALAFLQQARIALHLGNPGQAELWTKKALRDDPNFTEAQEFLGHLKAAKKGE